MTQPLRLQTKRGIKTSLPTIGLLNGELLIATDTHELFHGNASGSYNQITDTTKASLVSPTFTGTPLAPTATAGTNTTQLATTAFVTTAVNAKQNALTTSAVGSATQPIYWTGSEFATVTSVSGALPLTGGTMTGKIILSSGSGLEPSGSGILMLGSSTAIWSGFYTMGVNNTGQYISTIANGIAPLVISNSTTVCTNLNADLLDGNHAGAFQTAMGITALGGTPSQIYNQPNSAVPGASSAVARADHVHNTVPIELLTTSLIAVPTNETWNGKTIYRVHVTGTITTALTGPLQVATINTGQTASYSYLWLDQMSGYISGTGINNFKRFGDYNVNTTSSGAVVQVLNYTPGIFYVYIHYGSSANNVPVNSVYHIILKYAVG